MEMGQPCGCPIFDLYALSKALYETYKTAKEGAIGFLYRGFMMHIKGLRCDVHLDCASL
jgi:hypothetical protein